jgi:hypothetical protein
VSNPKDPTTSKLMSMLGLSEDDLIKTTDSQLMASKLAMVGVSEMFAIMNAAIKKTVTESTGKVPTNMVRLYLDAMGAYAIMLEKILNDYDTRMASLSTTTKPSPLGVNTEIGSTDKTADAVTEFLDSFIKGLAVKMPKSGSGGNEGGNGGGNVN